MFKSCLPIFLYLWLKFYLMDTSFFIPNTPYKLPVVSGNYKVQAPSNIALVKYWGKYGEQLPQNASVSFTLSECRTETTLHFEKISRSGDFNFEVYLDGKREESFEPKINNFFQRIHRYVPYLKDYTFKIETKNTFPHSSGIASSASGLGALAMCLVQLEKELCSQNNLKIDEEYFSKKASFLARLGSGSAARSINGPLVVWGEHPEIDGSSNLFGVQYVDRVHKRFSNYQDTILLVDKGEKQVSSTVGHDLMQDNPYAKARFKTANSNLSKLISVFESGDISAFIAIVESEALQLHGMMMASKPYFILMKPNTLEIINKIWNFRRETGSQVCFTLDAGANVHVLYPYSEKDTVQKFIREELAVYCKNGEFIHDFCGLGASIVNS